MRLHSPEHERELLRKVRHAIRASPALRKEYRRRRERWLQREVGFPLFRLFLTAVLVLFLAGLRSAGGTTAAQLTLVAVWTAGWALIRANFLMNALFRSVDLLVLQSLPLEEGVIYRWQAAKYRRSSGWGLVDALAAGVVIGLPFSPGPSAWAGICLGAGLHWLVAVSAGVWLPARFPRVPYGLLSMLVLLALIGSIIGVETLMPFMRDCLQSGSRWLLLLLPTGWVPRIALSFVPPVDRVVLLLSLPVLALISSLPLAWRTLGEICRRFYGQIWERVESGAPEEISGDKPEAAERAESSEWAETEAAGEVRKTLFGEERWGGRRRPIESVVWNWLSPRERVVAEFTASRPPPWSRNWMRGCLTLALGLGLGWFLEPMIPGASWWCCLAACLGGAAWAGPWFSGCTRVFDGGYAVGQQFPRWSLVPLGYVEISVVLLKVAAVRAFAALPIAALCGAAIGWQWHGAPLGGLMLGLKALWLALLSSVVAVPCFFSAKTNDTSTLRLRAVLVLLLGAVAVVLFLAAAAAMLMGSGWRAVLLGGTGAGLVALGFLRAYGFLLNGNHFDLVKLSGS